MFPRSATPGEGRRGPPAEAPAGARAPGTRRRVDAGHHYIWEGREDRHYFFDIDSENDFRAQSNLYPSGLPEEERLQDQLFEWIVGYDQAWQAAVRTDEGVAIDDQIRTKLEALGYLQ